VIAIIPTADRQKSTVKVRVGFVKLDPRILPEWGKVAFRGIEWASSCGRAKCARAQTAVQQQDGRDVVMVVQKGRAERRTVTVHSTTADEAIIGSGLVAGEKLLPIGRKA